MYHPRHQQLGLVILFLACGVLVNLSGGLGQDPEPKAKKDKKEKKDKKDDPKKAMWEEIVRDPSTWDQAAAWEFERKDNNGDGVLNREEMEGKLRDNLDFWDTNKDGLIDLAEYRRFFAWKMQDKAAKAALKDMKDGDMPLRIIEVEEDRRPTVYRAGKLPKGLPPWFEQLDRNKDGQVSLAEWMDAGKSYEDFHEIDRNDDCLLTIEEVLRFMANARPSTAATASASERRMPAYDKPGPKDDKKKKKDWNEPWPKKGKKPKF